MEYLFYVLYRYSCAPGFCSQTNGLSRGDVLGCLYFCYLDMSLDELIQHVEVDDRYDEWRGTGTEPEERELAINIQGVVCPPKMKALRYDWPTDFMFFVDIMINPGKL